MKKLWIAAMLLLLSLPLAAQPAAPRQDTTPEAPETNPGGPLPVDRVETIGIGATVTGTLDGDLTAIGYTFNGQAGQTIIAIMASTELDAFLELRTADGLVLDFDDDSGPDPRALDARLGPLTLPETGEYMLVAETYSRFEGLTADDTVGGYTLTLNQVEVLPIRYDEPLIGELTRELPQAFYRFSGEEGDIVNISVESEEIDSYVSLATAAEPSLSLAFNDNLSGQENAFIPAFILPESGDYLITVSDAFGAALGEFSLLLQQTPLVGLTYGEVVETEIAPETRLLYFSFEGQAGELVNLTVTSDGTVDTSMTVSAPDGFEIAYSDDVNNLDPAINDLRLENDGVYTVLVQPFAPVNTVQPLTVTLERSEVQSLNEGEQVLSFNDANRIDTVVFNAEPGSVVRLTMDSGGVVISPTITVTQEGQILNKLIISNVQRQSFDFTVPGGGPVFVEIEEYSPQAFDLALSLE